MRPRNRIAVVGFGLIGRRHVEVIRRSPDLSLAAIVEPDERSHGVASGVGAPIFTSLDEMIEVVRPDGVVLATPTPLHLQQGLICVEARIPLLIEKPVTVTSSEARKLTNAAKLANVSLLVGHHRRHNGMVQAAKAAIEDGQIGEIRAVQATCWFYKPDYYFEAAPWRTKKGAGPISVNLVHDVDLLRHFCGDVVSVQAIAVPSRRGFENEDLATAVLSFENGAVATLSVSDSIVAPWSWELTARENPAYPATAESCYLIGGSKAGMSLPDLRIWRHGNAPDWWTPISAQNLTCQMEDPLAVQMAHFAEVISAKQAPLVSGEEGLKSLEVVEAVDLSARTGRDVVINAGTTDLGPSKLQEFKNII
jgi:predicted dehydrogenase